MIKKNDNEFKSYPEIEKQMKLKKKDPGQAFELIKNSLIMIAITLIAGGILGFVYQITKEPIAIMEIKEKQKANQRVFVNAMGFSESILDKEKADNCLKDQFADVEITEVIQAFDKEKNQIGYVIEITSHEGYGGDIVFSLGIQNDGTTNGISITSISETPGLGMKADEVLSPQFIERNVTAFEVTKNGSVMNNQIDAISSATITSKAVTNGVNAALYYFREVLKGGN